MFSCEKVVCLLTLLLAGADNLQIQSCEEYMYFYINETNEISFLTWDELIEVVSILNSMETLCSDLHGATFRTLSGKLVGINSIKLEYNIDGSLKNGTDEHDFFKKLLSLSNDLIQFNSTIILGNPFTLEKSMFISNKRLETIKLKISIREIRENTFLHLEHLRALILVECRLTNFKPNELPSSLEILHLQNNQLQTFYLTKSLTNLLSLDLSNNALTSFVLDLRDLLPKIIIVSLEKNTLMNFQPIDDNLNHTLKQLNLNGNQIRNIKAYEWILQNRNITSWKDNFPTCDCSSKATLDRLIKENIVHKCILPVPGDVQVNINYFDCPATDSRDSSCTYFTDGLGAKALTVVFNCSNAVWPPPTKDIEYFKRYLNDYQDYHFYLSGNPDVRVLPAFPMLFNEGTKIHIYAENCNLHRQFFVENFPKQNLNHLYIANNSIDEGDVKILERLLKMETRLTLANNPLICDCLHKPMYDTLVRMKLLIDDFDQMTCNDGLPFADRDLCFVWNVLLYFTLILFTVLICFLIIFLRYTLEIQVYIYSRGWFPAYFRPEADDANYKYDVFVSYSDKDEDFVVSVIDFLEKEVSPPFKVCHHHRDWIVGERIDRQIIASVEESRKTVIILSPNFLTSVWANMEFRTALYTMLEEKAPKLILIVHGDIGPTQQLKPEIRTYIKTTTYLASDSKWFWKKLAYSLRRPNKKRVLSPLNKTKQEEGNETIAYN